MFVSSPPVTTHGWTLVESSGQNFALTGFFLPLSGRVFSGASSPLLLLLLLPPLTVNTFAVLSLHEARRSWSCCPWWYQTLCSSDHATALMLRRGPRPSSPLASSRSDVMYPEPSATKRLAPLGSTQHAVTAFAVA